MRYRYTGPADIAARPAPPGTPIRCTTDLMNWLAAADSRDRDDPFTYVITTGGELLLAPRRSEHVACAAGADVLAAGEITVDPHGHVTEVTNQSTGYGPQPTCWPAVESALDRAGIPHPGSFTGAFVFRHCPTCTHLNVIKDDLYICALCGAAPDDPARRRHRHPGSRGPRRTRCRRPDHLSGHDRFARAVRHDNLRR